MEKMLSIDGVETIVSLVRSPTGYEIMIDDRRYEVDSVNFCDGVLTIFIGTRSYRALVSRNPLGLQVSLQGRDYFARSGGEDDAEGSATLHHGGGQVVAPMPGTVIDVRVSTGDTVSQGDTIVVIESMKMQNEITAPIAGTVKQMGCEIGAQVSFEQLLAEIEPPQDPD